MSDTKRVYCAMHAQYLIVGGQLLREENELREKLAEYAAEGNAVEEQLDFETWWEVKYGRSKPDPV